MLVDIFSYVLTAIIPVGVYAGVTTYRSRANRPLSTPVGKIESNYPPLGISTTDYVIPSETEDEYLQRLQKLHPDAWKEYCKGYAERTLLIDHDRYVNMLILKFKNNEIKATLGVHTLDFQDGTELWISNKYYSFGNVFRSNRPYLKFDASQGRYSPYTFMCIVDLEFELSKFNDWKRMHDVYDLEVLARRKKKFGNSK